MSHILFGRCGTARRVLIALMSVLLISLAAAAPAFAQGSRLDEIIKRDKLIISTFSTAPPLCFTNEKGELVGFDIDIARLIAKGLLGDPNKIEFMTVTSEGRWPSVLSGKADFGI